MTAPALANQSFFDKVTTDTNVGMNEVVSVFVSKYEDNLFAKKDSLQATIRKLKGEIEALTKRVIASVDTAQYVTFNDVIGIKTKIESVDVKWGNEKENYSGTKVGVAINVGVYDTSSDRTYASFSKKFVKAIGTIDMAEHKELTHDLETANTELLEVMANIKQVSRKERQIRGRISELKLEQAGFTDLLQNDDLLKLIN